MMASLAVDEEVFCKHLSDFYESWKAVSPSFFADYTVTELRTITAHYPSTILMKCNGSMPGRHRACRKP